MEKDWKKRVLSEGTTEVDEIGIKLGLTKRERESVYADLGMSPDGE